MRAPCVICFGLIALGIVSGAGVLGQETPKKADPVKEDLKHLEGTWRAVAVELGGKEMDREEIGPNNLLVFSGTNCSTVTGKRTIECTFTINPSMSPKWIDVTRTADKVTWPGIYELKDGTLKVFLGTPGGKRPTEFKTKERTQQVIHTHERVKP
jgi:uncharacterized protein (TIGR03067 family)